AVFAKTEGGIDKYRDRGIGGAAGGMGRPDVCCADTDATADQGGRHDHRQAEGTFPHKFSPWVKCFDNATVGAHLVRDNARCHRGVWRSRMRCAPAVITHHFTMPCGDAGGCVEVGASTITMAVNQPIIAMTEHRSTTLAERIDALLPQTQC